MFNYLCSNLACTQGISRFMCNLSTNRSRNSYHQKMDDGGIDRISNLPDQILEHILSFLTTRQVVKTCILSKRWRNTWASVRVLEIDIAEFIFDNACGYTSFEERKRSFEQFVDYILDKREPTHLDRFLLTWGFWEVNSEIFIKWLDRMLLLKPKSVHIKIRMAEDLLPESLLHCESIQNLQVEVILNPSIQITKTKSINLPYLKCLRLGWVRLDNDFKTMLFQGCPLLEDLALDYCGLDLSEISSKMLKKLALSGCYHFKNLTISCPGLVSLVMAHCCGQKRCEVLSISYMPSLINADVRFSYLRNYDTLKLVSSCSNATSLTFLMENLPFKVKDVFEFKTFDKLKRLRIGWDRCANFALVTYFLQHSPHLQELIVQLPREKYPLKAENDWKDATFLREYLDSIIIENHHNCNFAMVDQLLKDLRASVRAIGKVVVSPPQL